MTKRIEVDGEVWEIGRDSDGDWAVIAVRDGSLGAYVSTAGRVVCPLTPQVPVIRALLAAHDGASEPTEAPRPNPTATCTTCHGSGFVDPRHSDAMCPDCADAASPQATPAPTAPPISWPTAAVAALEEFRRRMIAHPYCNRITDSSMLAAAGELGKLIGEYRGLEREARLAPDMSLGEVAAWFDENAPGAATFSGLPQHEQRAWAEAFRSLLRLRCASRSPAPTASAAPTARERLGAWLAESPGRTWDLTEHRRRSTPEPFLCSLYTERDDGTRRSIGIPTWCATEDEAISAALDALPAPDAAKEGES